MNCLELRISQTKNRLLKRVQKIAVCVFQRYELKMITLSAILELNKLQTGSYKFTFSNNVSMNFA